MSHSIIDQYIHIMWSTENLQHLISESCKNLLFTYLTKLVNGKSGKIFAFGGGPDHIHLLILMPGDTSLASFMCYLKSYSSKWIKTQTDINPNFSWQKGYTAISVQKDRMPGIIKYINDDKNRHISQKINYQNELINILKQQNIDFQDQYLLQNSYSNIILHIVWSTFRRQPDLRESLRPNLYSQIDAICSRNQSKILSIGGVDDHIHTLITISKNISVSDLMREVKAGTTHWLKTNYSECINFEWQTGFGAFSVSMPNVSNIIHYIENQEEHHKKKSYIDEWNELFMQLKHSVNMG